MRALFRGDCEASRKHPVAVTKRIEHLPVILIKDRLRAFPADRCLDVSFKRGVRFPWPFVATASLTISYGSGTTRQSFLNGSWVLSCGMDHEDAFGWFVPALRRSYARLAAWMVRDNRLPEPSRLPTPTRLERPNRIPDQPRRPAPARG
jgi:hypothetical protein